MNGLHDHPRIFTIVFSNLLFFVFILGSLWASLCCIDILVLFARLLGALRLCG